MGAFFTNVQIYTGNGHQDEVRIRVIETIRQRVLAGPYIEAGIGETVDRTILIGPVGSEPWITVLDEAIEEQDLNKLDALAATLSLANLSSTVGVLVHDSEILNLRLFRNGLIADNFCNDPNYFYEKLPSNQRGSSGHPKLWREILAPNVTESDLRRIWNEQYSTAEDMLIDTARLLGWNQKQLFLNLTELAENELSGFTCLRFRCLKQRTFYEEKVAGPPMLKICGSVPTVDLSVNEALNLHFDVYNSGGAGSGLKVLIWGPALQQDFIKLEHIRLQYGQKEIIGNLEAVFKEKISPTGEKTIIASFPNFKIIPGFVYPEMIHPGRFLRQQDLKEQIDCWFDNLIHLFIAGQVLAPGNGKLHVVLLPEQNRQDGQAEFITDFRITPPLRKPLRYHNSENIHQQMRTMEEARVLFGMVVLERINSKVVREAFESWHSVIGTSGPGYYETSLMRGMNHQPQIKYLKTSRIKGGVRWQRLCQQIPICINLQCTLRPNKTDKPILQDLGEQNFSSGFGIYNYPVYYQGLGEGDRPAPHVLFWVDLTNLNADERRRVNYSLKKIIDLMMLRINGIQAMMADWSSPPLDPASNSTAYENACGIYGYSASRKWCKQYLRGISNYLWLGEELQEQCLKNMSLIKNIAAVETVGHAMRIQLRLDSNLNDIERVLKPVLATQEDWLEFSKQNQRWLGISPNLERGEARLQAPQLKQMPT